MFRVASLLALVFVFLPPAGAQNPPTPAVPPLPGQNTVQLQFGPSSDVKEVLRLYEQLTGRRLVYDNQTIGVVPIVINEKVPRAEAIKIMEMALHMNGFSLIETETKNIWKVFGQGKNARGGAVPLFTEPDMLPDNEQFVSLLLKLRFADPLELSQTLQQAFPAPPQVPQSIVPLQKSQALLITENTPILRQIVRIVRELDFPSAEVESRFFSLERADAKDVQEKLENILTKQQQGVPGTPGSPAPVPRPQVTRLQTTPDGLPLPANAPPDSGATTVEINVGPNEESFVAGKVKITADVRTNRLHVIARPKAMEDIARLIKEFDANVPFGEPHVRPLQFVSANDIFQVIVKSVSEPGQDRDAGGGAAGGGTRARPAQSTTGLTGNTFDANRGGRNDPFGGGGGAFGSGGGTTLSEGLSTTEVDIVPDAVTIGNTRIIADKRANAIIVVGNRDVKEKIFKIIDKLDVRAPQVMLHTCIGQLTLNKDQTFGVNYILKSSGHFENIGPGTTPGPGNGGTNTGVIGFNGNTPTLNLPALLNQNAIRQIAIGGATGLSGFFTAGNAFDAIVTALESTNRFKVTSRPSVFASNNKRAIISSGQEIAIPTNIQSGFSGGGGGIGNNLVTNSSIQFKTVALTLEILPLINSNKEVTLEIVQKIQEQVSVDRIDNNNIPRIATRDLKTTVSIPNGATLVLGGLIRQSVTKNKSGIPYLSRIPIIGPLFGTTQDTKVRDELIILIRPEVTVFPPELVQVRERVMETYNMDHDLESTLIPEGLRQRVPPEPVLLRVPPPPQLREEVAPQFK